MPKMYLNRYVRPPLALEFAGHLSAFRLVIQVHILTGSFPLKAGISLQSKMTSWLSSVLHMLDIDQYALEMGAVLTCVVHFCQIEVIKVRTRVSIGDKIRKCS